MTEKTETTESTTEQDILDGLGIDDGDSNEQTSTTETTNDTEATTTTTAPSTTTSGQTGDKGTDGKPKTKEASGPQDLVGADGTIIAKSGPERRHYENLQKSRSDNAKLVTQVNTANAQLKAITDAGNVGTQFNLTPEQVTSGAQLIRAFIDDPVATVKYMLTQAQSKGYNIDGIGGTTDMAAIKQLLDNALSPMLKSHNNTLAEQEAREQATGIYYDFISQHPDATIHQNEIAQLLTKNPTMSIEAVYYRLQNYYLTNSLDWTKPLTDLPVTKEGQAVTTNTQTSVPEGTTPIENVTDTAEVADPSTSMDEIIRQSMQEAGVVTNS